MAGTLTYLAGAHFETNAGFAVRCADMEFMKFRKFANANHLLILA
jgi:hypothetical protein